MAGSRLHKIGTIFTRTTGLLKSGALKPADKPIWYDIYEAFPPKVEPRFDRPEPTDKIRNIFYEEDIIRAKFYKKFGNRGIINMFETNDRNTVCQIFIEEFLKRKSSTSLSDEQLMDEVAVELESRGIYIIRKISFPQSKEEEKDEGLLEGFNLSQVLHEEKEK